MSTNQFSLALAQMNPTVGDLAGNAARMLQFAAQAADVGADLVLFPEMALIGYPPDMTHASVRGTALAVPENVVRLSVGIEGVDDLIADLEQGLARLR